jgi:ceramide glucosyltransferase
VPADLTVHGGEGYAGGVVVLTAVALGLGWLLAALSIAGSFYTVMAGGLVIRFFKARPEFFEEGPAGGSAPSSLGPLAVTLLKPLHGAEVSLRQNLSSFFALDVAVRPQIVLGVQNESDPALSVAQGVMAEHPAVAATLCVGGGGRALNGKIGNLINMAQAITGEVLILSDSDIAVAPEYVNRVLKSLLQPGVGVVTCPYFGRGERGFWSKMAAYGLDWQFLPNVIAGVSLGLATPCMGSTIAIRRETLGAIGGFNAFCDTLADDYAIGAAVRGLGLKSVVAPLLVSHSCGEQSLAEVFSHELRWARTVRGVDPVGHAGSLITHPVPLAILSAAFLAMTPAGDAIPALTVLAAAFLARVWLMGVTDRVIGRKFGPWWLIPLRDMLSFCIFAGSFFVRSVEWRGVKFQVTQNGDLRPV